MDGCAKFIGTLIGIAVLGLGFWGSLAIGNALGFCHGAALLVGAGVISGGLLGLCVVGVGLYCLAAACKSGYRNLSDRYQSYKQRRDAERTQHAQSVVGRNTNNIHQSLGTSPAQRESAHAYPQYQQPQQTQPNYSSEYNHPEYYAPPQPYAPQKAYGYQ